MSTQGCALHGESEPAMGICVDALRKLLLSHANQPASARITSSRISIHLPPRAKCSVWSQGKLLSDFDVELPAKRGLAPRVIDPALLVSSKRTDFVTYIQNPHHHKGQPFGAATAKVAAVRNARIQLSRRLKIRVISLTSQLDVDMTLGTHAIRLTGKT